MPFWDSKALHIFWFYSPTQNRVQHIQTTPGYCKRAPFNPHSFSAFLQTASFGFSFQPPHPQSPRGGRRAERGFSLGGAHAPPEPGRAVGPGRGLGPGGGPGAARSKLVRSLFAFVLSVTKMFEYVVRIKHGGKHVYSTLKYYSCQHMYTLLYTT